MTVREFIYELQKFDQERNIWLLYDPPYAASEPEVRQLVGEDSDYAKMFSDEGVKEGDYAILAY